MGHPVIAMMAITTPEIWVIFAMAYVLNYANHAQEAMQLTVYHALTISPCILLME